MVNAIGSVGSLYNNSFKTNNVNTNSNTQQSLTLPAPFNGEDSLNIIRGYASSGLASGYTTFKNVKTPAAPPAIESKIGDAFKNIGKNIGPITKNAAKVSLDGAKFGALFGGITSAAMNGYDVYKGEKEIGEATGLVVADTMTAAVSGAGGAFVGVATSGILKAANVANKFNPIIGTVVGVAVAVGVSHAAHRSGLHEKVSNGIANLFGNQS